METNVAPESHTCFACGKAMQIAENIRNDKGEVIARRFICTCYGVVNHFNWHRGQAPETARRP